MHKTLKGTEIIHFKNQNNLYYYYISGWNDHWDRIIY